MNRKTAMVVMLLLAMILALTGTMMPEQAQAKTAALPGCKYAGCTGGSDECLTLTVVVQGIAVTYHCYSSYRVLQHQ